MSEHKTAPQGRAFAFELPERLRSADTDIIALAGIPFCHEVAEGLLYPLEAVCRKVQIPGVKYAGDDQ